MPAATLAPTGPPMNSTNPAAPAAVANASTQAQPAALIPFVQASREQLQPGPVIPSAPMLAGAPVNVGLFDLPAMGFAKGFWLEISSTGGTSTGGVTAPGDAPWDAIQTLVILDTNGAEVIGPLTGYELYLLNKYGGYFYLSDPATDPFYAPVQTTAGAGAGNFSFRLWVPFEVNPRDALGPLPNMDAAAPLRGRLTLSGASNVYGTVPTTLGTYNITTWYHNWTQPNAADMFGHQQQQVPDDIGTTSEWSSQVYNVPAGNFPVRLLRVGDLIRLLIFCFRNGAGVRDSVDLPNPYIFTWDGRQLMNTSPAMYMYLMSRRYGYVPSNLDTGVFTIDFCHELDGQVGHELRTQWLPTTDATTLKMEGSYGTAGTLDVITNDIAPVGDIYMPGIVTRA